MGEQDINDFLEYCGISATASTLKKIRIKIVAVDRYFDNNLDNLKIKDIHSYLSNLNKKDYATSTKNDFIKVFKRFLKWKYKDWNERFEEFKDMKANGNDHRKLSKEELLTPDEMAMIIKSVDNMKYKTLLLMFQETAGRPEELFKLKWKNISFDNSEVKLHSSKTDKIRTIPIDKTINHLKRYREECFATPPKANDLVFKTSSQAFTNQLCQIKEKLGLEKHLFAYLWRHSILTKMIQKLTPKVYENFSGHSLETGMKIYAHLDNEDLRKELNDKIYNIKPLTEKETNRIEALEKELDKFKKQNRKILMLFAKSIQKLSEAEKPKKVKVGNKIYNSLPESSELVNEFNKL